MKMNFDLGTVALAVKALQDNAGGVVSVHIKPLKAAEVQLTKHAFSWAFPDAAKAGVYTAHSHGTIYYCEME